MWVLMWLQRNKLEGEKWHRVNPMNVSSAEILASPNTMVYLAGEKKCGKTVNIEEDGTGHLHKTSEATATDTTRLHDGSDRTNCYKDIECQT